MIVMMAGLPGTGKSTLARLLVQRLSGTVLDKDIIRGALFSPAHIEYSRMQDDFCQEIMLEAAAYLLNKNSSLYVFFDGRTFSLSYQRQRVIEFCSQLGSKWAILECVCAEATALARLERAVAAQHHPAMNRTPDLYHRLRKAWEPIDCPRLVIDTDDSLDSCAEQAMRYLVGLIGQSS
jgi:adenylylsulfate kinase